MAASDGRVIAIFGPTGVGKTAVAIALAGELAARGEDAVAISVDALQAYAGLETLTGAPSVAERASLEHRLVATVPVTETYSVGAFMPRAHAEIDAALDAGRRPIVVGGTGLYLRAALCDLDLRPRAPAEVRARIERDVAARGAPALHSELSQRSPEAAQAIEPSDRSRVVRALELLEVGALHEPAAGGQAAQSQLWTGELRRATLLVGLVMDRELLYARIDARAETIVADGGRDEVLRAEAAGASRTARKALGYEELLAGDVEAMKRRTRRYAKRQLTWMRKLAGVRTVDVTGREPRAVAAELAQLLNPL